MKKFITTILALYTFAFGISESEIRSVVAQKTDSAIAVLKDTTLDNNAKQKALFAIFDPIFDYKQMAKISLGKRYNELSINEQSQFDTAFEQKLKSSYIDKLLSYTNQQVIIKDATKPQTNRYWLRSELLSEGKTYEFVYKFYDAKDRGWLIYDIDIIGVSIIQTYRSQFADMLLNADFNTLLEKLNHTNLPSQDK
ncbi:ABC transporter substrate-binding protein [Campylobacter sp. faydin G-24]|uniref:ABC transporter substrate-binding protein n=1 Tax=Campylobacter anatolicus TaxID=2829105 RepID=A0ABS5HGY8_9BACT|nr:ABC transporter substrate-binding protein [Campylobacter anatolicus]MBR8463280.1 ABC transporter substrate-binding protein [Campylobacter anatolicus]